MANVKATDLIDFTRASTGTYLDSDGTLKTAANNIPRIEYDADGNLLGLLIEEARTNLVTQSEDFNTSWSKVNSTVTSDNTTGPDGLESADLLVTNTANAQHRLDFVPTSSAGTQTFSAYLKAEVYSESWLRIGVDGAFFDLSDGTIGSTTAGITPTIQDVGSGWYRCSITTTTASANDTVRINVVSTGGVATFAGDGTSGIYVWGAQLETGSFPTSYIKTQGSAVSRAADVASIDVDQFGYNQSEGTVVSEFRVLGSGLAYSNALTDGTTSNMILQFRETDTSLRTGILSGGSDQTAGMKTTATSVGDSLKLASAFSANDIAQSLNGATVQTDSSASIPSGILSLRIGDRDDGTRTLNGHIKSLTYTPKRLSNAKLQELTS